MAKHEQPEPELESGPIGSREDVTTHTGEVIKRGGRAQPPARHTGKHRAGNGKGKPGK